MMPGQPAAPQQPMQPAMQPMGGMPAPQPMMDPSMMMFQEGLARLAPQELAILDQLITPPLAQILGKMFPGAAPMFAQFAAADGMDSGMMEFEGVETGDQMGGTPGPMPMNEEERDAQMGTSPFRGLTAR